MRKRGGTAELLQRAFGDAVFTTAMAAQAGISRRRVELAVADGAVVRAARGRFWVPIGEPDSRQRYRRRAEALLIGRPQVALAGVTAAAWWDLPCPDPGGDWMQLPVVLATDRPISRPSDVRTCSLAGRPVSALDGRLVTELAVTAVDVARHLPAPQALIVVDAVARRLAGRGDRRLLGSKRVRDAAREALGRPLHAHPRPSGPAAARTIAWADPAAESPPESFLRGHILASGLPPPLVNAPVLGASGRQYYVDLLWPDFGRGMEVDGRLKYVEAAVLHQEKQRQEDIEATGLRLTRRMAGDIFGNPAAVVGALRGLIQ